MMDTEITKFDEKQSLQVIQEMLKVSQKKLKNDGILFILWGWIMFITYLLNFISRTAIITYQIEQIINYTGTILGIAGITYTIYYIFKHRKKVQTYISISLRYIWIALFICQVLINLILYNVTQTVNFELQHPIFMVLIAFAIVITGSILRYRLIIVGGIVFGMLAYLSSHLGLNHQILVEAIAWLIAFIIPGHILFYNRNK